MQAQLTLSQTWQGPIPSPQDLREYAAIDPSFAERIIAMAEKTAGLAESQLQHRHAMEKKLLFGMNVRAHWGLGLAFVISRSALGGAVALGLEGHTVSSGVLGVGDLASLAGVFIYGRKDQAKQEDLRTQQ